MDQPIYITGRGMNCSLGLDAQAIHRALLAGEEGLSAIQFLPTRHQGNYPVGEIKQSDEELRSRLRGDNPETINRTALLAALAVEQAVEQAGYVHREVSRVGLFSGTTVGGMDRTENGFSDYLDGKTHGYNFLQSNDCGYLSEFLALRLENVSFLTTTTTACSSSLNSIAAAVNMMRTGQLDVAIAGGSDGLCRFTVNGFKSFMLLDDERCRPFDAERKGINLGEGAAYFVLETEAGLRRSGNTPLGVIRGIGNRNDAFHPTAISERGQGIRQGMKTAIRQAGLPARRINYVITHGTGTRNNDSSEGLAIHDTFGTEVPDYVSLKSSFGHTLGASGALNMGVGLLAIEHSAKYASRNVTTPMEELATGPLTETRVGQPVDHVLVNASGMGGYCTSLTISKT